MLVHDVFLDFLHECGVNGLIRLREVMIIGPEPRLHCHVEKFESHIIIHLEGIQILF